MPLNLTSSAEAIREKYNGTVVETVYYNDSLMGLPNPQTGGRLFEVEPNPGDTSYKWQIHTTANDKISTFSEGDPLPSAGSESYTYASLTYTYVWFVLEVTGHAEDALESRWFNIIGDYMTLAIDGMRDLFTTTFLNDTTVGLQAGIDDGNTYAGITRGSASYFESTVTSSVGDLARSDFETLIDTMRRPEKASRVGLWMLPPEQSLNYAQLADFSNADRRDVVAGGGKGFDLGWNWDGLSIHGAPALTMPDMTNTVALAMNTKPGGFKLIQRRPFSSKPLSPTGDNERILFTMGLAMPVKNPKDHGKLEGINV
jgi:hypothetical protein